MLFATIATEALAQAQSMLAANGFRILQAQDTQVRVSGKSPVPVGANLVFVRLIPELDEFEVISQGQVIRILDQSFVLEVSRDNLQKYPEVGDFALHLGDPKSFTEQEQVPTKKTSIEEYKPEILEPGYIQFSYYNQFGDYKSETPNQANQFKQLKDTSFKGFQLEWFVDFVSNYGISIDLLQGSVPIRSYLREDLSGDFSRLSFRLMYRTKKNPGESWRQIFMLDNVSEQFKTDNSDEYVISSDYSGMGLGWSFVYEPGDLLFTSSSSSMQFTKAHVGILYYPLFKAQDKNISRGDSSSGHRWAYNIGLQETFYLSWMPWVKRYFLQLDFEGSQTTLNFSGKTKSESGGFYIIPEGETYKEQEQLFKVSIGIRFDDFVGKFFKPRN